MYLGVDIGTSMVKAVIADADGEVVAKAEAELSSYSPSPGLHEQEPEEIWRAVKKTVSAAVAKVDATRLTAVCFSSAMHGLMALDKERRPLCRLITWADGRGGPYVRRLREQVDAFALYSRTGCPLQPLYYPAKLSWFKQEAPDLFNRATTFCTIKDLILYRLCGKLVMDQGLASSIGLLDIHKLDWDAEALKLCGIGPGQLPELLSPKSVIEGMDSRVAEELGLPRSILIVPGSGDGGLANLGSAAVSSGQAALTIGTSGAMRVILEKPAIDSEQRTWCYFLTDGAWYAGGAINSGGIVYRWVRDSLYPDRVEKARGQGLDPYDLISQEAESIPAGADGLVMLPYLMGERTPHWDPNARGVIFGLSPRHTRAHIARAALEGSSFAMRDVREALLSAGAEISELRASGGFMRSQLWMQILADVLEKPVAVPESQEGSALGAVFLAMLATGRIKSLSEVQDLVRVARTINPEPGRSQIYQRSYNIFRELYPLLKDRFNPS